ncbi:MAG: YaiI/YqxD family protein [Granulosicoccus sp.]|nr:YaiI/YqxD family protein [Granulosicoccus sp.]
MKIWVDADACPVAIRKILFKASQRTGTEVTLIANQSIPVPRSPLITMRQVPHGFDAADDEIVRLVQPFDLVITSDIPLASEAIDKGATALSGRGELFDKDNIRGLLNMRDFMDTLRGSGIQTGGQNALGQSDIKAFADHLDRWLAQRANRQA